MGSLGGYCAERGGPTRKEEVKVKVKGKVVPVLN
jgi:hypothetical protein